MRKLVLIFVLWGCTLGYFLANEAKAGALQSLKSIMNIGAEKSFVFAPVNAEYPYDQLNAFGGVMFCQPHNNMIICREAHCE